jgi:diaminobutyrate-2-oxoglutarate transaminase
VVPDIVCLSKSISGYGLPMALTLIRPELDVWEPGEHNGTFRGNNPAFVTATAALRTFWADGALTSEVERKAALVEQALLGLVADHPGADVRGRGLAQGVVFADPAQASAVCAEAFSNGLLLETSGPESEVVKLMPPLTVTDAELAEGIEVLAKAMAATTVEGVGR